MKRIIVIFFIIFIYSCNKRNDTTDSGKQMEMNKNIEPIVADFIKQDFCKECLYEMYIDKQSPYQYEVILYKGYRSLTFEENNKNKQTPLFYTEILNKRIDVFSGVEYFFKQKKQRSILYKKNNTYKEYNLWIITDSLGLKKIDTVPYAYPYLPKPNNNKIHFLK